MRFSEKTLDDIISKSSEISLNREKIDYLSSQFLDVPYAENTLIGNQETKEILTVNLAGLDCFTFIDYVESLRLSNSYSDFTKNLIETRYKNNSVSYETRNHFFTDWNKNNSQIVDVTKIVGKESTYSAEKKLNKKSKHELYLEGIPVTKRVVFYIPSNHIDDEIISRIKTGDYLGIYSDKQGLDVSHTGIAIKQNGKVFLRHASSREINRKVVDEDLIEYLNNKPGIVVFRTK